MSAQQARATQSATFSPANSEETIASQEQKGLADNNFPGFLFIQPKLTVGSVDDPLEKEADDMADKVMRMEMPSPINFSSAINSVNRKCAHCEEEEKQLQRKESGNVSVSIAPPIVYDVINSSVGRSLDSGTRSFMESRFNYDFSNVKIHDSDIAAKSASSINALAYTSGNSIVFNSGQYNTNSDSGKRLLAHELTHVVQQGTGVAPKIQCLGDLSKKPPMVCDTANTNPGNSVMTFLFATSSTTLLPSEKSDISIFVKSWQASGGTDVLRVDGYASIPGNDKLNWTLSCDRAFAVANELHNKGVPSDFIDFFAHGETTEFGSQANNQRADISMLTTAPSPAPTATTDPVTKLQEAVAIANQDCETIKSLLEKNRQTAIELFLQIYTCLTCSIAKGIADGEFEDPLWIANVNHQTLNKLVAGISGQEGSYESAMRPCNQIDKCFGAKADKGVLARYGCSKLLESGVTILLFVQKCTEDVGKIHLLIDLKDSLSQMGCGTESNKKDYQRIVPRFKACNKEILSDSFPLIGGVIADEVAIPQITELRDKAWTDAGCIR